MTIWRHFNTKEREYNKIGVVSLL